jgi:hypothetical protein
MNFNSKTYDAKKRAMRTQDASTNKSPASKGYCPWEELVPVWYKLFYYLGSFTFNLIITEKNLPTFTHNEYLSKLLFVSI